MYIAIRTDDGRNIGKISFYCNTLQVSRQAFYNYLERKGKPWKYQPLADAILEIHDEDEENADYGRVRMYQALKYRKEVGKLDGIKIPCEATVRSVMEQINLIHKPKRKPNGITKADREARKSDDLLKRDFTADAPLKKCVTDITEIKAKEGKLYVEPYEYYDRDAIFTCSAETLFKINEGKLDPVLAVTLGKLKVEGNIDKALYLKKLIDSRKAEQNAIKKTQKQK